MVRRPLVLSFLFSFVLISPALAELSVAEEIGGALLVLGVIGVLIFVVVRGIQLRRADVAAAQDAEREQLIRNRPPLVVRTYRGNQEQATALFQRTLPLWLLSAIYQKRKFGDRASGDVQIFS